VWSLGDKPMTSYRWNWLIEEWEPVEPTHPCIAEAVQAARKKGLDNPVDLLDSDDGANNAQEKIVNESS